MAQTEAKALSSKTTINAHNRPILRLSMLCVNGFVATRHSLIRFISVTAFD